jgi:uncharacterized LabA/DUF88 family protein
MQAFSKSTELPIDSCMKHADYPHLSCIDAENISAKQGEEVLWELHHFQGLTKIYGCKQSLKGWLQLIETYGLETHRHGSGNQAADLLIKADVWKSFQKENTTHFVFVTQDGGFAQDIRELRERGCDVTVIGGARTAKTLKKVCTRFILLDWT